MMASMIFCWVCGLSLWVRPCLRGMVGVILGVFGGFGWFSGVVGWGVLLSGVVVGCGVWVFSLS